MQKRIGNYFIWVLLLLFSNSFLALMIDNHIVQIIVLIAFDMALWFAFKYISVAKIKIKYFTDIEHVNKISQGDLIDLRAAEDVEMKAFEFKLIPLGVAMKLPKGYMAKFYPRSSTYKNFGIIQANHCAIIDNSFCGDEDQWRFPAIALRDTVIHKGDRICQFEITETMPKIKFKEVEHLTDKNRGGIGSTGTR